MNKLLKINKSFTKNLVENTYGLGKKAGIILFKKFGLNNRVNPKTFKRKQINEVNRKCQTILSGKKLKESKKSILLFLLKNKTYRGVRHKLNYPARGQRTHTNARTKKKFKF